MMESLIADYQFLALEWPWLTSFVNLFLKSSALLLLACVLSMFSRNKPASFRHLIWFAALLAILLLPLLQKYVPQVELAVLPEATNQVSHLLVSGIPPVVLQAIGSALYWTACTITLLILLVSFWHALQILRLTADAEKIKDTRIMRILDEIRSREGIDRRIRLLQSSRVSSPVSWGFLSPAILFPANVNNWPDEMLSSVLEHELSHIERLDWLTLVFGTVTRAIYWYNPLVWFALYRMNEDAELACDDAVLLEQDNHVYAKSLVTLAREHKYASEQSGLVKAMAQSFLGRRIMTVLDNKLRRIRSEGLFMIRAVIVSISAGAICASVTFVSAREHDLGPVPVSISQTTETAVSQRQPVSVLSPVTDTQPPEKPAALPVSILPVTETVLRASELASYRQQYTANSYGEFPVIALEQMPVEDTVAERPLVSRGVPKYPDRARGRGIEGYVVIRYQIDEAGLTYNPSIVEAEPEKVFNRAALNALEEYRYLPETKTGTDAIDEFHTTRFSFELEPRE